LETKRVKNDLDDNWVWLGDENDIYSVRNAYIRIRNDMMGDDDKLFYKLWTTKVLPSTQFYAWRVMLDRDPIAENLVRVGITGINNMCVLCQNQEEFISHILFICEKVRKIWDLCDVWASVQSVNHSRLKEHFLSFEIPSLNVKCNFVWKLVWKSLVWIIWKARNNVIFRNKLFDAKEVFLIAQIKSLNWVNRKYRRVFFFFILIGV